MCDEYYFETSVLRNKRYYKNGTKPYEGVYHCTDGPAIEWTNGDKEWYINGKRHREDGPAVECVNGSKSWFINDKEYSEEEYWRLIKLKAFI